ERSECRTEREPNSDQAVGETQTMRRQMLTQKFRAARERGAFAQSQHKTQREDRDKSRRKTCRDGGERPQPNAKRERAICVDLFCEPARKDLPRRVDPAERA